MTPQAISGSMFGVGILSSVLTGVGQYESGQQQKQAYDYNADITLANTRSKASATQQQYTALVGRQAAGYAASGVDVASGSPLLIMAATAGRGGLAVEQTVEKGNQEAALERYYGKIAAFRGTMGGIGSFLSGITQSAIQYKNATGNIPTPTYADPGDGSDD